jgi:S-adenosylmethionine:tRNA ribosyltransferase-isomerase
MQTLKKSDFYYELPDELIAQTPVEPRNSSRLMHINKADGSIDHDHFYNLCNIHKKGDLLVMNDSRVIPARLYGDKLDNQTFIEFLLLEQKGDKIWEIICRPGGNPQLTGLSGALRPGHPGKYRLPDLPQEAGL